MKTLNETILNNISPLGDYLQNVSKPLKLLFLGEVSKPDSENDYFKFIKQDIEDADLVICNYRYFNEHNDAFIKYLHDNGVRYTFLADRHCYDEGLETVKTTVDRLYDNDMWHSGVYHDDIDRKTHTPSIIRVKGFRIGFMNYTVGLTDNKFEDSNVNIYMGPDNTLREKQFLEEIDKLKEQEVDMIICGLGFGDEYSYATTKKQKTVVEWLFSQDVSAVIGYGSHYVQKIEFNPQDEDNDAPTLVAYSLGNCLSQTHIEDYSDADGGLMLKVNIDKENKVIDSASYKLVWCGKSMYESDDAYYAIPIRSQNIIKKDSDKFSNFVTNSHNLSLANNINVNEEI